MDKDLIEKYQQIEREQRVYLDPALPLVIRLDGRGVTRNHEVYHLIPYVEWREPFFRAAKETVLKLGGQLKRGGSAVIYGGMDEVSVVYSKGGDLFDLFEDTNAMYAAAVFLQEYTRRLREIKGRETDFGISVFSLRQGQEEEYLSVREEFIRKSVLDYYAKVCNIGWSDEPSVMQTIYNIAEKRATKDSAKEAGLLKGLRETVCFGQEL